MTTRLETAIVRILDLSGNTVGTGFVVTDDGLIVTCAHVVDETRGKPGDTIDLVFHATGDKRKVEVHPEWWRDSHVADVAFLRTNGALPKGVNPLPLGSSAGVNGHEFQTYGFPKVGDVEGLWGYGTLGGKTTIAGQPVLQLSGAKEVTGGFSGGPVWDIQTRRVVGMVTATTDPDERWRLTETAFITPTETLRDICPALQLSDICPYRGLAAFTETDAEFFFGREALVTDLMVHLRRNPRFLAVVGPSGSGKSSVVRAGLFPKLRQDEIPGSANWYLLNFRPGNDPFAVLAKSNLAHSRENSLQVTIQAYLESHSELRRLVLFVDQFEELFALCTVLVQDQFISELGALLESELPITVILTLRADFYGHLLRYNPIVEWLKDGQVNIPPMSTNELKAVIALPAQQVGLQFEPGLVELITGEAGQINHPLPLLESALTQLWVKRLDSLLTQAAYRQIGQVTGAIGQWAEDTYNEFNKDEKQLTRQILTRLVHYGEDDTGDTRRKRALSDFEEQASVHRLVQRLADARLLITDRAPNDGEETVEIIHDALLREWKRLKRWLTEQREFYLWRQRLDERLREWQEEKGELLHDASLTEAERWQVERSTDLNQEEQTFIQDSIDLRDQEKAAQERLRRRIRVGVLTTSLIFVVMLSVFAWIQRNQAITQSNLASTAVAAESTSDLRRQEADYARATAEFRRKEALSRQLAAEALNIAESQYDLALLLSLQAHNIADTAEARAALLDVLEFNPHLTIFLQHSNDINQNVVFSPDGKILATSTCQRDTRDLSSHCSQTEIRIWDVATGDPIGQPYSLPGWVGESVFSPDGKTLALINNERDIYSIVLWDVETQRLVDQSFDHNSSGIAFSPDGQILASGGFDRKIKLWDMSTGQQIGQSLIGHNDYVMDVTFSPDGTILASSSVDGLILLWDLKSGQLVGDPLIGHTHPVLSMSFSPDGKMLASAGSLSNVRDLEERGQLIVWDVETHQPIFRQDIAVPGQSKVAFGPGSRILAMSSGNIITLWDMVTKQPLEWSLKGHTEPISNLAFSSDGVILASSSWDGTIILWNLGERSRLGQLLIGHNQWVTKVAFSPDSKILASSSFDKKIVLWNVNTGQRVRPPLTGHTNIVRGITFSPDGRTLASGDGDGVIILWDVATGQAIGQFDSGHEAGILQLAFSPDGQVLASSGPRNDSKIILWDVATGQSLGDLTINEEFLLQQPFGSFPTGTPGGFLTSLEFSSDGKTLMASGNANNSANVMLWDINTRQREDIIGQFPQPTASFGSAFSPDSDMIASGDIDGTVFLWDIKTGELTGQIHLKDNDAVWGIEFSPDGKMLATSVHAALGDRQDDRKGKIGLWDMDTLKPLGQLPNMHADDVKSIAISPDGRMLASGDGKGVVILWDISFASWQAQACHIANRNFTMDEWRQYIGFDIPYERTCPDLPSGKGAPPDAPTVTQLAQPTRTPKTTPQSAVAQEEATITSVSTQELMPSSQESSLASVGTWRSKTSNMPQGLNSIFPAFIQCRENADSDQLTQQYLGLWVVEVDRQHAWISDGTAEVVLESESGTQMERYKVGINLAANETGWLISDRNKQGLVMANSEPVTTVLKLLVRDIEWKPVSEKSDQYAYRVDLHSHSTYGNSKYPQHIAVFQVYNLSNLTMKKVQFMSIVQNQNGDTVDILSPGIEPGGDSDVSIWETSEDKSHDLAPDESGFFIAKSHSESGRCVGPVDPEGYTLHYWLNFETEDGQKMTEYYTTTLPGSEE